MFKLYWVSNDRQSSLEMGEFETREAAEAAIPSAWEELRGQGHDLSGHMVVEERGE